MSNSKKKKKKKKPRVRFATPVSARSDNIQTTQDIAIHPTRQYTTEQQVQSKLDELQVLSAHTTVPPMMPHTNYLLQYGCQQKEDPYVKRIKS